MAVQVGESGDVSGLRFVDLNLTPHSVVSSFVRTSEELSLLCPQLGDTDTAVAIVEDGDAGSSLYVARWTGAAAETPEFVPDSGETISVKALMLR